MEEPDSDPLYSKQVFLLHAFTGKHLTVIVVTLSGQNWSQMCQFVQHRSNIDVPGM